MLIKRPRGWEIAESLTAPETVFLDRRRFLAASGLLAASALVAGCDDDIGVAASSDGAVGEPDPSALLYPPPRNEAFKVDRPITPERIASSYNNFFEFGSHKHIQKPAQALPIRPWEITIDGEVDKPLTIGIDDLLAKMPLEERVYRLRCVETWAICVPWSGFPLAELVKLANPTSKARYLRMETFHMPEIARSQRQTWYPWPYVEAVTIEEATNDLAFMVTGAYGKPLPKQHGAPLRLAVPWKYGFKSIKSITRFSFVEKRPMSFWEQVVADEYGFWANINPDVAHPRWSQATERLLPDGDTYPTRLFNGYAEQVAHLYPNLQDKTYFR